MSESSLPAHVENLVYSVVDHESIVAITDKRGIIVHANDRFCEISGYNRGELLGKNHRILKSGMHQPEFYRILWTTILSGNTWHGEICNKAKDGHLYWVDTTITPLRVEGLITHFLALRTDISSRKQIEETLRETYQRQENERRMAALGNLADGVLHDLNNILTGMLGMAAEGDSELRSAMLQRALNQMVKLTRMLRDYSTGRPTDPSRFPINPLLLCVISLVRFHKAAPRTLRIETDLEQSARTELLGLEAQVFEILLNLGVNAVEALARNEAPVLRISTRIENNAVLVRLSDNGPGVPAALRQGLFESRSSEKGPGRGLGLAVARRLALELKGDLRLDPPAEEGGASFTLRLPTVQPAATPSNVILACDDDAVVRRMIQNTACRLGLKVEFSPNFDALLDRSRTLGSPAAAILIDSCNEDPEKGDVAELRRVSPEVPLILVSAKQASRGSMLTPLGPIYSLPKPFDLADLLDTLKQSLQRKA
jgi:PAS domain S-box-containing protein